MAIELGKTVPVFRIYSYDKAREFYVDFLGFKIDWEAHFTPEAPVYMQVSRANVSLHLSEHHGDCTPGALAYVYLTGVEELQQELAAKNYRHNKPGLQAQDWGMLECTVTDPFNNRIVFGEYHKHLMRKTPT